MGDQKPVLWKWMTGSVDISKAPPIVTIEGRPALSGESYRDYSARMLREGPR